jgi:hypothetical protein
MKQMERESPFRLSPGKYPMNCSSILARKSSSSDQYFFPAGPKMACNSFVSLDFTASIKPFAASSLALPSPLNSESNS